MDVTSLLGYFAASLTTFAFLPQLLKVWKQKSARDISLITFLLFSAGILLWLLYGIAIKAWPVIAANSVTFVLAVLILYFRIRYR